ncbi:hypothetical protein HXX02_15455 [Microbulbifer elongatus]|uniref:Uncharacterized protein n=1 Tax=Microbulbifer elongatus TaxID=86173 RepID=A0ABT1P751_9GAMM|nr:hypothetical protein [Microbulbifer elongatus]MCQ3830834.1 hypothetical protein [Microbulbifer elongatus]
MESIERFLLKLIWILFGPVIKIRRQGRQGWDTGELVNGPMMIAISLPIFSLYIFGLQNFVDQKYFLIGILLIYIFAIIYNSAFLSKADFQRFYIFSIKNENLREVVELSESKEFYWPWLILTTVVGLFFIVVHGLFWAVTWKF